MSRIVFDARKVADFGIGSYIRGLLAGLAAVDRENEYVLLGDPARAPFLPALPESFTWRLELAPGYSLRELWSVSRSARAAAADLFHAPHYVLPLRLPCPAVATIHDLIHLRFRRFRTPLERVYARAMVARTLRLASRTIVGSLATAAELRERFGALAAHVVTVPYGVEDAFFSEVPAARLAETLARHGLAPGYLLFVGNPKPHKNLAALLSAYARLRRDRDAAPPLVLVGASGDSGVVARARESSGVRVLGKVAFDDLPPIYRGATCVVVPSLWEGFGLPAAEAMACGVAVAVSSRGGLVELAGDAAPTFDPENEVEMASVIGRLLDDESFRLRCAERGRERAARLRWRSAAAATLEVYRQALAERSGAPA